MPRLIVLPFVIEPHEDVDRADLLLGRPLARDLARRAAIEHVEASRQLVVEAVDPLSGSALEAPAEGFGCYVYTPQLAGELAPALIERLSLDGLLHGSMTLDRADAELALELSCIGAGGETTWQWRDTAHRTEFQRLLIAATHAIHASFDLEPSGRERERLERITTRSLDALRPMALAELLRGQTDAEALVQRMRLLQAALERDSGYVDAITELAETQAALGHAEVALDLLERWLDARPEGEDESDVRVHAGRMALQAGLADRAVDIARSIVDQDPYHLDAQRLLASAHIAAGDTDEAMFAVREALWRFPQDLPLRRTLALGQLARGETTEAIEALTELVSEAPSFGELQLELAHAYEAAGQLEAALQGYRDALQLGARITHTTAAQTARLMIAMGRPALAGATLGRADQSTPGPMRAERQRTRAAAYLAVSALMLDSASVLATALAKMGEGWMDGDAEPDAAITLVQVELSLLQDADLDGLATMVETWRSQSMGTAVDRLILRWWAIALAIHRGQMDDAQAEVDAITDEVEREAIVRRLWWHLARARRHEDVVASERICAVLLRADPDDPETLIAAVRSRAETGDVASALSWLAPLLDACPSVRIVGTIARLMAQSGRHLEASAMVAALREHAPMDLATDYAAVMAWLAAFSDDMPMFRRSVAEALFATDAEAVRELLAASLGSAPHFAEPMRETIVEWLGADEREGCRLGLALELLLDTGARDEAEAELDERGSSTPVTKFVAGRVAWARGDVEAAGEAWRAAMEADAELGAGPRIRLDAALGLCLLASEQGPTSTTVALELLERAWLARPTRLELEPWLRTALGAVLAHPRPSSGAPLP